MTSLMAALGAKAHALGIPLGVQLDLTYRCNERCVHCYLDHEDHGEMSTEEILALLPQLEAAGTLFLTLSGGEIFMRRDLLTIIEAARARRFCVRLKTNAVMVRAAAARRLAELAVDSVQVSVYSHRPEVHDAITKRRGSFERTIRGIRLLRENGLKVTIACVLMQPNAGDQHAVQALAHSLGVRFTLDPTITPMMDGDRGVLGVNIDADALSAVLRDPTLGAAELREPPKGPPAMEDAMATLPCSAGHTACYISPYGDVYPCVQFPLACGNVRQQAFEAIWRDSPQFAQVRGITLADLHSCSSCTHGGSCSRCPGLAWLEGDLRGPSTQDCEKSFARTGVPSRHLAQRGTHRVTWLVPG